MTRPGWKNKFKCVALVFAMALPSIALAQTTGGGAEGSTVDDAVEQKKDAPSASTAVPPTTTASPAVSESSAATATKDGEVLPDAVSTSDDSQASGPLPANTSPPNASATSAGAPPDLDGATYRVRLRDLEQRVDELKEQIRRSHTRLSLLSDTILSGAAGGARAEIEFVNDLSGAWHVVEAVFVLDGAVQYKKSDDTGVLAKQKTIPIFSGSVPTGDHTLQVMLKLRGHGFGVFSYLRGIEASVTSDHSFTLTDGKVVELRATAWEQGGPTTPVEQQPAIRFKEVLKSSTDSPAPTPAKSAPATKSKSTSSSSPSSKKKSVGAGLSTGGEASAQ